MTIAGTALALIAVGAVAGTMSSVR